MLSKWLFISLLALGVQNIFADNYIGNYIDITKYDITKYNITKYMVFYDPNTHMALKGALENVNRNPFPGVGFRGIKCNCEGFTCGCCSGINITRFNIDRNACTNFTYYPENLAIKFKLIMNEREVLSTGVLSAKNPAPFCVPFYPPFISFCVRFFDIYLSGLSMHACIDFEALVVSWPILTLHFDCIKIGPSGVAWLKPEDDTNLLNMAVIMPEVNGPEVYDEVAFEPDSIDSSNNHTSNMTLEEEAIIGQLKL